MVFLVLNMYKLNRFTLVDFFKHICTRNKDCAKHDSCFRVLVTRTGSQNSKQRLTSQFKLTRLLVSNRKPLNAARSRRLFDPATGANPSKTLVSSGHMKCDSRSVHAAPCKLRTIIVYYQPVTVHKGDVLISDKRLAARHEDIVPVRV